MVRTNHENNDNDLKVGTREAIRAITQETRANLIQDILGHPKSSPSKKELDYMNPSRNPATLKEHLDILEQIGLIEKIKLPEEERKRDLPNTFYYLTDGGRTFLEKHNILVDEEEEIKEDYAKVEKDPDIRKAEEAPRPL